VYVLITVDRPAGKTLRPNVRPCGFSPCIDYRKDQYVHQHHTPTGGHFIHLYMYIYIKTSIASQCVLRTCPWIHGCVGVYVGTGGDGVPYDVGYSGAVGPPPYVNGGFSSAASNPRFIFLPAASVHAHEYKVILMASVYISWYTIW
jgi:hypothetical protein